MPAQHQVMVGGEGRDLVGVLEIERRLSSVSSRSGRTAAPNGIGLPAPEALGAINPDSAAKAPVLSVCRRDNMLNLPEASATIVPPG
jgi:hypothetical protein